MKKLITAAAAALILSTSTAMSAGLEPTPTEIYKAFSRPSRPNKQIEEVAYSKGILKAIEVLQDYNLIDNYLCDLDSIDEQDIRNAISFTNPDAFENTPTGGAVYVFISVLENQDCYE